MNYITTGNYEICLLLYQRNLPLFLPLLCCCRCICIAKGSDRFQLPPESSFVMFFFFLVFAFHQHQQRLQKPDFTLEIFCHLGDPLLLPSHSGTCLFPRSWKESATLRKTRKMEAPTSYLSMAPLGYLIIPRYRH